MLKSVVQFLRLITTYGVRYADSESEKRNITLANYISLLGATVLLLLILGLFAFYGYSPGMFSWLLIATLIFLAPLLLNRTGFTSFSRVLLCWLPPLFVFGISILDIKSGEPMSSSSFVGLRLFLLAGSCFPFLFFDLKFKFSLILGLSVPLLSIIFFDPIFNFFDASYLRNAMQDRFYEFSNIRALVSMLTIWLSLFFLKRVVERNERLNHELLKELEEKNELIRKQAEADVNKLNAQLSLNLQQLSEREFILKQSQRVAKVGSWEYRIGSSFTFWSEEMYNILGLDIDVDIKSRAVFHNILSDESRDLFRAAVYLLRNGKPFDITIRIRTTLSYLKWVRIYAFPRSLEGRIIGVRGICHDVTYYKEAEDLLRSSESKYRSLFEHASDFIAILDAEGNILDANESWCITFGYPKHALMNMKVGELIDPDQFNDWPQMFTQLQRGEHVFSQWKMVQRDKTVIDVESNIKKIQEGKMLMIARDVTKLREVQNQIQISEAKFRGAFEYSAIGMAIVSLTGQWLKVNRELCHIVGYTENELLALNVRDMTVPEESHQSDELQQMLIRGERESIQQERRYIHLNGSIVWVNFNISLVKDSSALPLFFVAQIEDITADKKAKEKLLISEANLKATINNTELMIWSVDRDYNLLMVNNQFEKYILEHYNAQVQLGERFFKDTQYLSDEVKAKWLASYTGAFAGNRITLEDTSHGVDFQYSLNPIFENNQVIGVSIFADNVTERKARDRELAEANKKIGELKLMALRSVMSPHFIFNVLNSIQYFIAKNDRLNAINYLSMFSRLVRSILSHSVDNKISLAEEIELLDHYIRLEMVRFENKFTFSIEIAPDVEPEFITLPSLLIQPYVENAILHGLYNKKTPGELSIRVSEKDDVLTFEIEDNGIGREAAIKLRKQNFPAHTSMGLNITEERLKLINLGQQVAFEIEDLRDENGPCGTRVRIMILLTDMVSQYIKV